MTGFTTYRTATDEDKDRLNAAAMKFIADYLPTRRVFLGDDEPAEWAVWDGINNSAEPAYLRSIWNRRKARALRLRGARDGYGIAYGYVGCSVR